MQSPRPPTHRLRFSPPRPATPGLPALGHPNSETELFSYISVLPAQFYGPRTSLAGGRPEAELMRAVLADALLCFQKGLVRQGRRVQRLAREAEEWLFSADARWPFSFVSICAVLGLEPEYIRRGLKRWGQGRPSTAAKKRLHAVDVPRRLAKGCGLERRTEDCSAGMRQWNRSTARPRHAA